jgi:hypothetical protein
MLSQNISLWMPRSRLSIRAWATALGMPPMPSWRVAPSQISWAIMPPMIWSSLLMGAGGTSVMGRSLSTSASTSEMWMWLPKVRGMVGLTSRNRRPAFLRISLRSAAVPQLKYPCRSMGETVQ